MEEQHRILDEWVNEQGALNNDQRRELAVILVKLRVAELRELASYLEPTDDDV